MGVLDDLALSGVERVERSLGTRAALRALMPVIDTLPASRGRARGILRGVRYAAELDEPEALALLATRWSAEPVAHAADARRLLVSLLVAGRTHGARVLAEAEVARTRGQYEEASSRYALGRCHEAAGEWEAALAEHRVAAHLAGEQPRLRQFAGAREVRALSALGRRAEAAARAAALLPLERGEPEDRLALAVAALDAPGRYKRAGALDLLEILARKSSSAAVAREAIRAAARHAERAGSALSVIEADRVDAVLAHWPDAAARALACARLRALVAIAEREPFAASRGASSDPDAEAHLARARAVADGNAAGPRPERGRREIGWLGLAAVAALRAGDRHEARELARELVGRIRGGARIEAPAWTLTLIALGDERLAEAGRSLAEALLASDGEPPPRGFARLAEALDAAGSELATEAWRRAAARREPGARERLAVILRHRGWTAAQAGERERAVALLREARRLSRPDQK